MGAEYGRHVRSKKKVTQTDRQLNTAVFLLRCTEVGLSTADLDLLTVGMVIDMLTEKANDEEEPNTVRKATQEDFDKF